MFSFLDAAHYPSKPNPTHQSAVQPAARAMIPNPLTHELRTTAYSLPTQTAQRDPRRSERGQDRSICGQFNHASNRQHPKKPRQTVASPHPELSAARRPIDPTPQARISGGMAAWRGQGIGRCEPPPSHTPENQAPSGPRDDDPAPQRKERTPPRARRAPSASDPNQRVRRDSNPQPLVPKTNALSIELRTRAPKAPRWRRPANSA